MTLIRQGTILACRLTDFWPPDTSSLVLAGAGLPSFSE